MSIKRIGMITVHASPLAAPGGKKTGGLNVYVRELAKELAGQGVAVDIFTRRVSRDEPEVDYSIADGVRVIAVNAGPPQPLDPNDVFPYLSQFAAGVIAFTTKQGGIVYDILYSHYWLSGWVANKLNEVWNTPFIHMYHTLGHMKNRITATGVLQLPDMRINMETNIAWWADRIIAATPAEYSQLLWLYRADRRKIAIVPPGVDDRHFRPIAAEEAKRILGLSGDKHFLLWVGRIEPLKAIDTILEALALIRNQDPEVFASIQLAIIGGNLESPDEHELHRLRALATELKIDQSVQFLGAKEHGLLPLYYSAASAVLVPSDYESFGMVALEAMASGAPVIATEVGGLAYLVKDNQTGLLVPSRDPRSLAASISLILTQPDKRKLLGKNAARLAEQYSWSRIAARLLTIMEDVIRGHKQSGAVSRHRH